jgi:nucleobase:cation symporter-1, NCS1 family
VRAAEALPIILFGNAFPLLLIAVLAVVFARYGVEHWQGSAAVFGHRLKDVWLVVYITSSFGWIAYASFLFGQSAMRFLEPLGVPEALTQGSAGAIVFAIGATALGAFVAFLAPRPQVVHPDVGDPSAGRPRLLHLGRAHPLRPARDLRRRAGRADGGPRLEPGLRDRVQRRPRPVLGLLVRPVDPARAHRVRRLPRVHVGMGHPGRPSGIFSAFVALALGLYDPSEWIANLAGPSPASGCCSSA